jgi:hypothetical protein
MTTNEKIKQSAESILSRTEYDLKNRCNDDIASIYFEIEYANGMKISDKLTFKEVPKKKGFWMRIR